MSKRLIGIIFHFLAFALPAQVKLVEVNSNTENADLIKAGAQFRDFKALNDHLQTIQLQQYKKGYLAFSVDSLLTKDSVNYAIQYHQGEKYQWGELSWLNAPAIALKAGIDPALLQDQILDHQALDNYVQKVLAYYENNGFPFSKVQLVDVLIEMGALNAHVKVEPGPKVVFADSIIVHGDLKVSTPFLQHYLGVLGDHAYDEKRVRQVDKRLKELAFARMTKESAVEFHGTRAVLHVYLDKKSANFFNGVIGVLPNSPQLIDVNSGSNLLITGDAQLLLINALKQGERINLNWNRLKPETQRLKLGLNVPFLLSSGFGLEEELDFLKQDSSFLNFKNSLGISYALAVDKSLVAYWENAFSNVLSSSNSHQESSIGSSSNSYGLNFIWEQLDYKYNPRKGFRLFVDANAGIKKMEGVEIGEDSVQITLPAFSGIGSYEQTIPKSVNQFAFRLNTYFYVPIFKLSTIKLALKNAFIHNKYLFLNDLHRIGGFKVLRGFDEQSLFASWYHIATIEYRLLLEQNSYVSLFFDQAFTQKNTVQEQVDDYPYGFGASVSFQSNAGVFSLIYALGSQQNNPIDFRVGKIHFGFVSLF